MDHNGNPYCRVAVNVWIIFAVSLVLHLSIILALGHYHSPTTWENGVIAKHISRGYGFAADFSLPNEKTSWQAPGYPYLLVAAWRCFGESSAASYLFLSILQAVAVSSMVFPIGWLTQRWFDSQTASLARWVTAFMPLYAWYATRIHHTAFVMAMHPWLLWGWISLYESPAAWRALGTGFLTGVAGLFQPVLLVIFGLISLGKIAVAALRKQYAATGYLFLAGIITLLTLTPWTIRNYQVHQKLLLVKDSFGKEFWMGNNPHATGTGYADGGREEVTNVYPPDSIKLRGHVSEIKLMDALQSEAWDYCKANPAAFAQRTIKKITWLWTMTPSRYERSISGGEALSFRWLHAGYWFVFVAMMITAAKLYRPWSPEYGNCLILYIIVYSLVYGLTHVGQARFRGEIEYILMPGVSAGMIVLWQWLKGSRNRFPAKIKSNQTRVSGSEDLPST